MQILDTLAQWLHILAAVLAIGGVFCLRFVLSPAIKRLPPEHSGATGPLLQSVGRGFKMVVHASVGLLILTGVYRLVQVLPFIKDWTSYHMVLGVKILLALILFVVAIMLTLPGQQPNYFQRNRDRWLLFNFILGAVVVLLSATLRRMWDYPH